MRSTRQELMRVILSTAALPEANVLIWKIQVSVNTVPGWKDISNSLREVALAKHTNQEKDYKNYFQTICISALLSEKNYSQVERNQDKCQFTQDWNSEKLIKTQDFSNQVLRTEETKVDLFGLYNSPPYLETQNNVSAERLHPHCQEKIMIMSEADHVASVTRTCYSGPLHYGN